MGATRFPLIILVAAWGAGCAGYRELPDPEGGFRTSPVRIERARVTLRTGERFELEDPCVYGDSLRGIPAGGGVRRVGLAEVRTVEVPKRGEGGTAGFVDGAVLAQSDMRTRPPTSGACAS